MDNQNPVPPTPSSPQPATPASAPVTPSGSAYTPPPSQTPPSPPSPLPPPAGPGSSHKQLLLIACALFVILLGGGGYLFMNMQKPQPPVPPAPTIPPSPTLLPSATPMSSPSATASDSANWKTYTGSTFSFQYPQQYTLQERTKNFIELLSDPKNPQSIAVIIDATRPQAYEKVVADITALYSSSKKQNLPNGVKISGTIGNDNNAFKATTIILTSKKGAIVIEDSSTENEEPEKEKMLNQLVSSFTLL